MKRINKMTAFCMTICTLFVMAIPANAASRPAELSVNAAQVDTMVIMYSDYRAGYIITGQKDQEKIIKALNQVEYVASVSEKPVAKNQRNLYIRFKDGSERYYNGYRNVLMSNNKRLSDGFGAACFYKAIDECSPKYQAYPEWMLTLDPYQINEMSAGRSTYSITTSKNHRDTILKIVSKCKYLPVDYVESSARENLLPTDASIAFRTPGSKEEYTIWFEGNGYFSIQLHSEKNYQLTYHCSDQALYDEIVKLIKAL